MNYLCHGYRFLAQPYFLAGTAVPDWLNVVNRRAKARPKQVQQLSGFDDDRMRAVARGILQHHHDDDWFHRTRAFAELSLHFTDRTRSLCHNDPTIRSSFVGHILVELLLDAVVAADRPGLLDGYYRALEQIDPPLVQTVVDRIVKVPAAGLGDFIAVFQRSRFLYDYAQDDKLLMRMNNVMRRVRLPSLPHDFLDFLPEARTAVRDRMDELLVGAGIAHPGHDV